MKTPFLTTSFSESGKQAKSRFANILDKNIKSRGVLAMTLLLSITLFCGILVGCGDATSVGIIGGADGPTQIAVLKDFPAEIHTEISKAILSYNKDRYVHGDCYTEGHIILDTEVTDDKVTVYTLSTYGTYNFCGDHFEHGSGCGMIPTVLVFDKDYNLLAYKEAEDGARYTDSIKEMFPEIYHERIFSSESTDADALEMQKRAYAETYLKSVGKEGMPIGDYGDFH